MPEEEPPSTERWEKGGGGFGPIKVGSKRLRIPNRTPKGESGGWRRGDKARLEVAKYQKDGGYLIPKVAFQRLAREIFEEVTKESHVSRIESSAIEAIQMATEAYMSLKFNCKFSSIC
jgi:ribosomal protein L15